MLELVKLVKALSNTKIVEELGCVKAQCLFCGMIYEIHLCDMNNLLDVLPMLMDHQESH